MSEFINIGLLLLPTSSPPSEFALKFLDNWDSVSTFDPSADPELLQAMKQEFLVIFADPNQRSEALNLLLNAENAFQLVATSVHVDSCSEIVIDDLAKTYLGLTGNT